MKYTMYEIKNKINSKLYIGVHKTNRINDSYFGSGKYLNYSISKYGKENFSKLIIAEFRSEEIMYLMESWVVNEEIVNDPNYYNIKLGGIGGWYSTSDMIEKVKKTKAKILENGLNIFQIAGIKSAKTSKNTILENGLSILENSIIKQILTKSEIKNNTTIFIEINKKRKLTMSKLDKDGLTGFQKSAIKAANTRIKNKTLESLNNPNSKKYIFFNSDNEEMFGGIASLRNICKFHKMPYGSFVKSLHSGQPLYNNIRNNNIKFLENNGNIKYKGWRVIEYIEKSTLEDW